MLNQSSKGGDVDDIEDFMGIYIVHQFCNTIFSREGMIKFSYTIVPPLCESHLLVSGTGSFNLKEFHFDSYRIAP
jgi:hypothetical protein